MFAFCAVLVYGYWQSGLISLPSIIYNHEIEYRCSVWWRTWNLRQYLTLDYLSPCSLTKPVERNEALQDHSHRRVSLYLVISFLLPVLLLLTLSVFSRIKEPPNIKVSVRESCMFSVLERRFIYWHSYCYSVPFNCVFLRKLYWLNLTTAFSVVALWYFCLRQPIK